MPSPSGGAMSWTPIGSPELWRPNGIVMAGQPAMFHAPVSGA